MRLFTFRYIAAAFLGAAAIAFLGINSTILARGAARYATDEWDKTAYAIIAGTVPWILAIMPLLVHATWKAGPRFGRPTTWTLVICAVWVLFVAYNVLGAGGAVNTTRTDTISARKFDVSRERDTARRREALVVQLERIKDARPVAELEGLLAAQKAQRAWERTEGCQDASRARSFCTAYGRLLAEHGAAERREQLEAEIRGIDEKREVAGWVAEVVDPAANFWAYWTGLSELTVQRLIPITIPIVLEVGSMVFLSFALILAGFTGHRNAIFTSGTSRGEAHEAQHGHPAQVLPAAGLATRTVGPAAPPISVMAWLAAHVRPVSEGQGIGEDDWYAYYSRDCALSNVVPVPIQVFRSAAQKHGAIAVMIDGRWIYERVLPLQPKQVGAA